MRASTLLAALCLLCVTALPAEAQQRVPPPFDPLDGPERWYRLRSSVRPLTIWFTRRTDRSMARRVGRLLLRAWRKQVDELGFRAPTPYDPSGGERYHVFLMRGAESAVVGQRSAGAAWDAWETYMTLDPWGEYGGPLLRETVVHEFNHALQGSDDWWESASFFEMSATFVQEKHFPDADDYLNDVAEFQARPHLPPDHDDGYESLFMYGGALYLFFLEDTYFQSDPTWLGKLWEGARNPPLGENEPDWIDALNAQLPSGTTYADTVVAFARWRYYTGPKADGRHFHDAEKLDASVPIRHRVSRLPRTLRSAGPHLLGSEYVRVRRPSSGAVTVSLTSQARARWRVQIVPGLTPGSDGDDLPADGRVEFGDLDARVLVVTPIPLAGVDYDPDAPDPAGRLRYRLRITAAQADSSPAGGLVDGVD